MKQLLLLYYVCSILIMIVVSSLQVHGMNLNNYFQKYLGSAFLLHDAIIKNNKELIKQLLNTGCGANQPNEEGDTPFNVSYKGKNACYETTELLLAHNADVNKPDHEGVTALSFYVREMDLKTVTLLLKHKADPNTFSKIAPVGISSNVLRTPLHIAAQISDKYPESLEIIKLLLAYGADVNKKIFYTESRLETCSSLECALGSDSTLEKYRLLLRAYPNIALQNFYGETIFHIMNYTSAELFFQQPEEIMKTVLIMRRRKNTVWYNMPKPLIWLIMDIVDPLCRIRRDGQLLQKTLFIKSHQNKTPQDKMLCVLSDIKKEKFDEKTAMVSKEEYLHNKKQRIMEHKKLILLLNPDRYVRKQHN